MKRIGLFFFLSLLVFLLPPVARADLVVRIVDANPLDQLTIFNTGCAPVSGRFVVDFGQSSGRVHIDTAAGGAGAQDPYPVSVARGPAKILEAVDGGKLLVLALESLPHNAEVLVTFDMDSGGWLFDDPVVATGPEIAGTRVEFQTDHAILDKHGAGRLVRSDPCPRPDVQEKEPTLDAPLIG